MPDNAYLDVLKENVLNLDFIGVKKAAEDAMKAGVPPVRAITDGLAAGIKIVGERFERKEYFLSELFLAAETMKQGMSVIQPYLIGEEIETKGKVVLATVKGDYHDIGKSLVATLLRIQGFDVIDLGIDVPTDTIVEAIKVHSPNILGLSALLTVTMPEMEQIINCLIASGIRDDVKVIVGGSPVTNEFASKIGADFRAADAIEGVNKCIDWIS